ncbi:MAG: relaxase domain-containing protein [Defluviicoccus sp.]|nr:relaxase domain-containing protein [Defluviicoccus sp.]
MVASLSEVGSASATVGYFAREGYYAQGDRRSYMSSFWHGKGARALRLPKHVSSKPFAKILAGFVPGTEIRLGRARDGEHQHRPGLDLTLSAPKSVSLEALLHGDRRVTGAHDAAVRATLDWVEAELLQTRGYDPATGRRPRVAADGLVAATFRHLTSRDQDPQLHTHCILANMTRNRAGDWRSMEPTQIRRSVKLIGAYYRQELARRLMDMGFRIETTMIGGVPGFEIAGYPRPLLDEFSSRRREILSWLEKHGLPYSKALTQQAALITRARKTERGLDELKAEWTARAGKLGVARDKGIAKPGRGRKSSKKPVLKAGRPYVRTDEELAPDPPGLSAREIVWRAVEHLAERASVFRESDVRAMALSHAPGRYALAEIDAAVTDLLGDGHLVEATVRGGRAFVTGDALRSEREILSRMREGKGAARALAPEARVSERMERTTLTAGQKEAVRTIVLSEDRIVAVQGAAGTGKTTMLREALGLIGERPAILLAPSAAAARVLADETGARARTLQWFLTRHGDLGSAEKMKSARREHEGAVLVLDESSMVSTAQMELLMRIAERLRIARLALVGDRGQLRAVTAGEPFRALQEAGIATAEMDEIMRQRDPALKQAVERLQAGRPSEALAGMTDICEVPQDALGATAARLWLELDPEKRSGTAILAPTHFIRAEIHRIVRDGLASEGVLHGRELEIERFVNRHLTASQRADVRNHEPGDYVIFHSRVPPLRVLEGEACRIERVEGEYVHLSHPSGRTIRIRPGDSWVRYRFAIHETARIHIRAGDRIRWTANDKVRGLVNGGEATVREIGSRRVRFDLANGETLTLRRDDPQLRHIDHAWSSTVHAAQGMTRDAAIAVLDTGHGELGGQAALYVEASRARDRFVLVTDNRETLAEALEENDGAGMTAREAVGEDDDPPPTAPPPAAVGMMREFRDDWRALAATAEAENLELNRMDDYARIVTGVAALAEGIDLPADLAAFAAEVRDRDAAIAARRRDEIAFVQKADMHCRNRPLLNWAAEEQGKAVSELPEHAAWRAEGEALAETGRALREEHGIPRLRGGGLGRIAAALGRIVGSFRFDEAERFRDAAAAHEAEASALDVDPRYMAGADALAERAASLETGGLPDDLRRTVEAWTAEPPGREVARRDVAQHPRHAEAGRRIAGFLRDCRDHLDRAAGKGLPMDGASEDATLDGWLERAETLRGDGLRMLGEAEGARLDDPARIRLAGAENERGRVRDAVDGLADAALRLRTAAFAGAREAVDMQAAAARCDPADLPAWDALRTLAEELRDEPDLAPEAKETVDAALAHDLRVRVETAPVAAFLEAAGRHIHARARIDEGAHAPGMSEPDPLSAWREASRDLRDTARNLLGEPTPDRSPGQAPDRGPGRAGDVEESRAASRLEIMPSLREQVETALDRLEAIDLRNEIAAFQAAAASVEERAREENTLPLHAEGYGRVTEMAQGLIDRQVLPDMARDEAGAWLDRDRDWQAQLETARDLAGQGAEPAGLREAARLPAVAAAVRRETDRLAQLPVLERGIAWTGDAPLIAGDRIAWQMKDRVVEAAVVSPGAANGMRADDTLVLRIADPTKGQAPAQGQLFKVSAQTLLDGGCIRAPWQDAALRALELARQRSVPDGACRMPCREPVPGDRIVWTEAAGQQGGVRTIEARVEAHTETDNGRMLDLRVIRAAGPNAPEPGSVIQRTAEAVTARGCHRAPWRDEARRERMLDPPRQEQEQSREQDRSQERSRGRGMSM